MSKIDPSIYDQVVNLKEGEVSRVLTDSKPRTSEVFFKIITVTNKTEEHVADFAKDYTKIRELALRQKQTKAIDQWKKEKAAETYIKLNGAYKSCDFAEDWLNN